MRFVNKNSSPRLVLYAWVDVHKETRDGVETEVEEFFLSPQSQTLHGRRPMQRFDSKEELEEAVHNKGNSVTWLA